MWKIFAHHVSDKELLSKRYKTLKIQKLKNNSIFKNGKTESAMANKHMKRCSTFIMRDITKTTVRHLYTPIGMTTVKQKLIMPSTDKDVEQRNFSYIAFRNAKWSSHFGKQFAVSHKVKHEIIILSSNPSPKYFPSVTKTYIHTKSF